MVLTMTEYREETEGQPPSQPPTRAPSRRSSHRRRHPAAGTRKVLAAGSVAATVVLTGGFWAAAQAKSEPVGTDEPTVTTDDSSSSPWYSYEDDSNGYSEYESDSDSSVSVSPSDKAPDTSSRAS